MKESYTKDEVWQILFDLMNEIDGRAANSKNPQYVNGLLDAGTFAYRAMNEVEHN